MISPSPRSKTRRASEATHARKALLRYTGFLDLDDADQGSEDRMKPLLWALAHIEKILAEETRGRWGSEGATPRSIARRYKEDEVSGRPTKASHPDPEIEQSVTSMANYKERIASLPKDEKPHRVITAQDNIERVLVTYTTPEGVETTERVSIELAALLYALGIGRRADN